MNHVRKFAACLGLGTLLLLNAGTSFAAESPVTSSSPKRPLLDQQIQALKAQNAEVVTTLSATIERLNKTSALTPEIRRAEFSGVRMQLIELGSQLQADAPLVLAIRKMEDFAAQQIKRLEGEKGAEKGVRADAVPNIDKLISDYKGDMQAFAKGRADIDVLQKEIKSAQDGLAGAERLVAELLLREESDAAVKQMNACLEEIGKLVKKTNEFITSISSRA